MGTMTTTQRLIRRVMTVVATMMIAVGVIAMHSFTVGHGPTAPPERTSGTAPLHAKPHEPLAMTVPDPAPKLAPALWVSALTGKTLAPDHLMGAICPAVLPPMTLLIVLALLRLKSRQLIVPSEREVPQRGVAIRGSPPRRTTPSLSQLCVLRA